MRYLSMILEKLECRKTDKLEKLWREAHDTIESKAKHKDKRVETADSLAVAERPKGTDMVPEKREPGEQLPFLAENYPGKSPNRGSA